MAKKLMPWDPFREIDSLRGDMERLFDSMLGRYPHERVEGLWAPPVDVEETENAILVRAELPGMKKKDIKISLSGDTLCISGERKHKSEEKGRTFHRIEQVYGKFQRSLLLPADVVADKAKASYKNGILELSLPKSEQAKAREIAIETD